MKNCKSPPSEILKMLNTEDYYKILKIRKNPYDFTSIRWNVLKNKFVILNNFDLL